MSQTDRAETVFFLHFLGGSARAWDDVARHLSPRRCVALDLPGFGEAAGPGPYTVAAMADHVAAAVGRAAPSSWALVGHSMGGKVAAVLARRAEDGDPSLAGLRAVVLVSASPAGPEPISAARRARMLGWFRDDAAAGDAQAREYVAANVAAPLPPDTHARTVADVVRADPGAWRAWLEGGSREDWTARVGVLRTPALVVAGEEDDGLGPDAQRALVASAFHDARLVSVPGAGHLLPIERAAETAGLIAGFLDALPAFAPAPGAASGTAGLAGVAPPASDGGSSDGGAAWRALLGSDRVSERTRAALLARGRPDDPGAAPRAISPSQRDTLRLVLDRVVPQPAGTRVDLAARVDAMILPGDGWRLAWMPPDAAACAAGLDTLERAAREAGASGFAGLTDAAQDALLHRVADGALDVGETPLDAAGLDAAPLDAAPLDAAPLDAAPLDAAQMRVWFEDIRSMAVRAYMAHPATLARLGYSGIGYGGDGPRLEGFTRLGIGEREPWEPIAEADAGLAPASAPASNPAPTGEAVR